MEIKLKHTTVVDVPTRCLRTKEFVDAINYLLDTYPPSRSNSIQIKFVKKDGINLNASGDYTCVDFPGYFGSEIRISYGQTGKDAKAVNCLFHEYKHLLQADAGYLYAEKTKHINHCIEAQQWADAHEPIYKESKGANI
jgi:hypothetical protein